jgi:hypothetical protein
MVVCRCTGASPHFSHTERNETVSAEVSEGVDQHFRHQRIEHRRFQKRVLTYLTVLNAFRHQRIEHQQLADMRATVQACSTPFGINESNIADRADAGQLRRVLNAFRHQRIEHELGLRCHQGRRSVLNAFRHQRIEHILQATMDPSQDGQVLNAFRHQRIEHIKFHYNTQNFCPCSTPFGINECVLAASLQFLCRPSIRQFRQAEGRLGYAATGSARLAV